MLNDRQIVVETYRQLGLPNNTIPSYTGLPVYRNVVRFLQCCLFVDLRIIFVSVLGVLTSVVVILIQIEAYTNPNLTTWVDDYKQTIPKNKLMGQC